MDAIEFRSVSKQYQRNFWNQPVWAVQDLSFTVPANAIVGFVGPNGAGKTTSLKMLMGLVFPTRGTIRINGLSVNNPAARAKVAFVTEQPYFYPYLTVRESLALAAGMHAVSDAARKTEKILALVQLENSADTLVKNLSKGMQQRLNLAGALIADADCFVLDEPMSGLDPLGRTLFKEIFKNLKNSGKTIFFSTHILQDIESLCESVVVLSRGRLYHQGSVTELLSRGLMGTDIRVAALPTELVAVLENLGCKCHSAENSSWNIFVPLGTNLAACQKLLCEKSVLVELLAPRHQSLENVLYAKN